jgi:hypothetical protein
LTFIHPAVKQKPMSVAEVLKYVRLFAGLAGEPREAIACLVLERRVPVEL